MTDSENLRMIPRDLGEIIENEDSPGLTFFSKYSEVSHNHEIDLRYLSASFLLVFMSFGALQNLESSINHDEGLGQLSLGIVYITFTLFSVLSPAIVLHLGSKQSIMYSLSAYWIFGAANLIPSWWTLVPASIFLGFSASVLWVAQGSYLTVAAKFHAQDQDLSEEATIGSFNGRFWSCFASTQILGNLVALAVCLVFDHGSPDVNHLSPHTQTILLATLLVCLTLGTVLASFMREKNEGPAMEPKQFSLSQSCADFASMLEQQHMLLLLPTLVYSGLQQAFLWASFTESVVTPCLGVAWIPGVMTVYGVSDVVASFVAGHFSRGTNSMATILLGGMICQAFSLLSLLLTQSLPPFCSAMWVTSILWGVGDAALHTQISALLVLLNPNRTEAALAQWKVWQSGATAVTFFVGTHIGLQTKLWTLLTTLTASVVTFCILFCLGVQAPTSRMFVIDPK